MAPELPPFFTENNEMIIAEEAYDFMVKEEVTSPRFYERHYRRPEWPGGSSGITVGCGYDLGYASPEKIRRDWQGLVSESMLVEMIHCSLVRGREARALLPRARRFIDIPWSAAEKVFRNSDLPQWEGAVQRSVKNTDKISPLCFGMLVATAYNRGVGGFNSNAPRFAEMRAIANEMAATNFKPVGNEFLSMRRLWPTMRGLRERYTETSRLWDKGLTESLSPALKHPPAPHDGEHPLQAGPARTPPPLTSGTQNGVTGSIIGGAVVAAQHFPAHAGAVFAVGCIVAAVNWIVWLVQRNMT